MAHICTVDTGAADGYLGAKFALADQPAGVLACGATFQVLRAERLCLVEDGNICSMPVHASGDTYALGTQDVVVAAVEVPAIESMARGTAPFTGPETCAVIVMSGVPWWFSDRRGPLEDLRL